MSREENLRVAQDALSYVQALGVSSANVRSARVQAAGGLQALIGQQSTSIRNAGSLGQAVGLMRHPLAPVADPQNPGLEYVLHNAALARAHQVGNCDDLCAIAMEYFYTHGTGPADMMALTGYQYDHAFIVVGLPRDWDRWRPVGPNTSLMRRNLRDWGPDAVWLDLWQNGGIVFPVADLIRGAVRNLDFRFGLHTADAVESGAPRSILRIEQNLI